MPQAGDCVVVQVDVCHLDVRRQAVGSDGKSMIVRGDLDLASSEILDRLVTAAMAEFELVGLASKRFADQLMAEANAEHWFL